MSRGDVEEKAANWQDSGLAQEQRACVSPHARQGGLQCLLGLNLSEVCVLVGVCGGVCDRIQVVAKTVVQEVR